MAKFFTKPSNVLFEQASTLVNYQNNRVKFNPRDGQHVTLITDCSNIVTRKLQELQAIDKKMTIGFAVGAAALALSWILPFGLLATAGIAYGTYQLALRQNAYKEYNEALENLSNCCIWSLGEVKDKKLINDPTIKKMMETLAPLTNSQQLADFIDDSIEDDYIDQARATKEEGVDFLDTHIDKEQTNLYFKIYGYKQGGFLAVLEGVGYAIQNGFKAVKNALTGSHDVPAQEGPSASR